MIDPLSAIILCAMAKRGSKRAAGNGETGTTTSAPAGKVPSAGLPSARLPSARPSALLDTRVIYCGDNLEQLARLPDACVDLIYIDPPFNSNRNYEVFWGETKGKHAYPQATIEPAGEICRSSTGA